MTDRFPEISLKSAIQSYIDSKRSLDHRLRIGEVLLSTIQRAGDMFASVYSQEIVPAVVKSMHDENVTMKASSISLLAAIAECNIHYVLPFVVQVEDYTHHALIFEESPESKRAVVYLMVILLRNGYHCGELPVKVTERMLQDLEWIASVDQDELTRGHAQTLLKEFTFL